MRSARMRPELLRLAKQGNHTNAIDIEGIDAEVEAAMADIDAEYEALCGATELATV
jgi:hypothetical protein